MKQGIKCCAKALIWKIILTGIQVCHKVKMYLNSYLKCYKKLRERAKLCMEQFGHYYRRW